MAKRKAPKKGGFKWWYVLLALLVLGGIGNMGRSDNDEAADRSMPVSQVEEVTEAETEAPTEAVTGAPTEQKTEAPTQAKVSAVIHGTDQTVSLDPGTEVWLPATGEKFHKVNDCGRMNPDKARQVTVEEAVRDGYDACDRCYG